jgi:Ca-activated chloride channel family protein
VIFLAPILYGQGALYWRYFRNFSKIKAESKIPMQINLNCQLSNGNLPQGQTVAQRQLAIGVSAQRPPHNNLPLNLCLILDHSGSMAGKPMDTVKKAACELLNHMNHHDRISVVGFNHKARVVVPNQPVDYVERIKSDIYGLKADGGTCIDDGIKLGLVELAKGKDGTIGQAFILTDGENEHGNNERCLQFASLATEYNITLHALGFGDFWNQDILEKIADVGGGKLVYIPDPSAADREFQQLLQRVKAVGVTNAHLLLELAPGVRLAELKPIAQVAPETIELNYQQEGNTIVVRLGDILTDQERAVLVNLYINYSDRQPMVAITRVQVRYDNLGYANLLSSPVDVSARITADYCPTLQPEVQNHVLALAKYRQTQMAEAKLKQGDMAGAATMLQSAAQTALQMGDRQGATILQTNATRLQAGTTLSEADRKQTRIVAKTVLQPKPSP